MEQPNAFGNPKELAADLRTKVGLSAGYASDLANGKRAPSLELAVKIERMLSIPAAAWVDRQSEAA